MKRIVCLILTLIALPLTASAPKAESLTVTVYNDGRALISEVRPMKLPQGIAPLAFTGVPQTMDEATLQARSLTSPEDFNLLEMRHEHDVISAGSLLDHYVGKSLKVILPDPRDSRARLTKDAVLLASGERPVFRLDNTIYVGPCEAVLLPEIPEGMRSEPALTWLVDNRGPVKQDIEVSYLAQNLSWKADYILKVNTNSKRASLSSWVTLSNECGMTFKNAALKLVAGKLHRARPEQRLKAARFAETAPTANAGIREEDFFEYHLYNLPESVDIGNRQTKQISLLQAPEITVTKELVSRFSGFYPGRAGTIKQNVEAFLIIENKKENGLGLPLPAGTVRAYRESEDGGTLLIGEDHIEHTPQNAIARLKMGEAFDLKVERKLTDYRKPGQKTHRFSWQIAVTSGKAQPERVLLQDTLPGEWRILKSDRKFEKIDARTIQFDLTVPGADKKAETIVSYEVEVEY